MFGFNQKISNEEIFLKVEELRIRLSSIAEVNKELAGVVDQQTVFDLITQKLAMRVKMYFATIWIYKEEEEKIYLASHSIPKIIQLLAEKSIGKKLNELHFSKSDPEQSKSTYFEVIEHGEPIFSKDLYAHTYPFLNKKVATTLKILSGMQLAVSVPVRVKGKTIGVLSAIWKEKELLEENRITLFTFADQISTAVYNSRLFQQVNNQIHQLEIQNHDLQSLNTLSSRVSKSLDPLTVAQNAVDSLPQDDTMLGAIITEHNVKENKLEIITLTQNNIAEKVSGIIGDIKKYTTDLNNADYAPTLTYRAFMMQEPQFSDDLSVYLHPPVPKAFIKPVQKIIGVKSVAVYPLKMRNKTIGTVAFLIKNRTVAEIDDNQKRLLQTFTTQISIALDNARLFKTAEETKRNLEQALRDLQEVRRRERDMIDIMGHELRTPLSIARNSLSMLNMELEMKGEISLDKQKKYVAIGLDAARREADLVETLLSATKVEGKGFQLTFEKVDLKNVIDISLIEFKRQADSKGLELILEDPEVPVFVYADKTRIQEIADNLIGNAIKYTPEGSVTISLSLKDNLGWLHVKDTGFGIAKADLRNLGKKFFRAKQYTKHANEAIDIIRPGGTGLGLFVSFALVKVMDGTYSVESELGEGSTFSFGLPLYSNQPIKQVERKIEDYLQSDEPVDNVVEDGFSKS